MNHRQNYLSKRSQALLNTPHALNIKIEAEKHITGSASAVTELALNDVDQLPTKDLFQFAS